ncbi:hypothetical protein EVAR_30704_1 [Eumeta japonica]|uniref:TTF-type domain-containing protein n=1 Tax=Eumeta variegata TaxID=151549 RepID=A0A4C1V5P8_EUMVA|nr:hypothetical protein EVAR_30704_1 [Eumeta japonica]
MIVTDLSKAFDSIHYRVLDVPANSRPCCLDTEILYEMLDEDPYHKRIFNLHSNMFKLIFVQKTILDCNETDVPLKDTVTLLSSGGLTYKHYKHVLGAPVFQGPPSSAGVSFYTYILSRFIHNMSEITRREQSGSDSSYIPAGPCPLRAPPARRVAPRDRWRTKRKQAELKKKKQMHSQNDIIFPTNQLESGKDNNVCQESQSLSSVRIQIEKNSTTGTSDDNFDDDEINSEIKTPVPVPDKSEPVIVAIPEVSKIELVNSNKRHAGLWTEFSEEDICYWIDHGPENCQHHQGPFHESRHTYASGKSVCFCTPRLFFGKKANGETYKREWLLYSKTKGSLYCFVCKLFGNKSIATAPSQFAADGFSDWRNVIAIEHHENSSAHKDFMLTYLSRRQGLGITKNLETQVKEERKYWKNVLQRVIAVIQTLAERGFALRGHDESFGSIHNWNFDLVQEPARYINHGYRYKEGLWATHSTPMSEREDGFGNVAKLLPPTSYLYHWNTYTYGRNE